MIKNIRIDGFLSFAPDSPAIELNSGVNLLVGINGSGKSNFLKALGLLQEDKSVENTEKPIDEWDVFLFAASANESNVWKITIYVNFEDNTGGYVRLEKNAPKASVWRQSTIGADFGKNLSIYHRFDFAKRNITRRSLDYYSDSKLLPKGENLVRILNFLNINHAESYDKIVGALRNVNPNFQDLYFLPEGGRTSLVLKEKNLDIEIPIYYTSDGTLNFLSLMTIFYNPNRGKIICLDQPENGLHPDMILSVAEGIKYAARTGTQIIVATHSPLLLNQFELEDILIFEKNEDNSTLVKRKTAADFPEWGGDDYLMGQKWLNGNIGGVRW